MTKNTHSRYRCWCGGFTLIELLVVVSIIALLVSLLMPALGNARQQAKLMMCLANLHEVGLGSLVYSEDNASLLPHESSIWGGLGNYLIREDQGYVSTGGGGGHNGLFIWFNLGRLYGGRYIDTRESFICPVDPTWFQKAAAIHPGEVDFYDHGHVPDETVRTSYLIRDVNPEKDRSSTTANRMPFGKKFAFLCDSFFSWHGGFHNIDKDDMCNVLYADGHVESVRDQNSWLNEYGLIAAGLGSGSQEWYVGWSCLDDAYNGEFLDIHDPFWSPFPW